MNIPATRCFGDGDPLYEKYHDDEWGRPVADEAALFERVSLEAFQSGLSWLTILRRREGFRTAFHGFDPARVAEMEEADVERLLADTEIIRNRAKIEATIANARALLALHGAGEGLSGLMWRFVRLDDEKLGPHEAPAEEGKGLSRALKAAGFRFVGPTTAYAALQATGVVNDHLPSCDVRAAIENERRAFLRDRLHG